MFCIVALVAVFLHLPSVGVVGNVVVVAVVVVMLAVLVVVDVGGGGVVGQTDRGSGVHSSGTTMEKLSSSTLANYFGFFTPESFLAFVTSLGPSDVATLGSQLQHWTLV